MTAEEIIQANLRLPREMENKPIADFLRRQDELIEAWEKLGFSRSDFFKKSREAVK